MIPTPKNQIIYSLVYTRVSSKSQKKDGSGDASQEVRCIEYSNTKGYCYEKTFEDVFTGGGNYMNRKGMVQLLQHIDENKDKRYVVIFDDLKRFARDVKFHIKLREELGNRNVHLDSPNFHFDNSPEGEANELHTAVSNQLERKQNQRQVIQKQTARLTDGYWPFNAPLGYSMRKVEGYGKVLFPNNQIDGIKEALEGFATMLLLKKIDVARFLKAKGFFGKQPAEKYIDTTTNILRNILYTGYIEYPKRGILLRKGQHEGIISLETYEAIQRRLDKPEDARIRRDIRPDFPVRGFVNCATCGIKMTAAWCKGKYQKYAYYCCYNLECPMKSKTIPQKDIESKFEELLTEKNFAEEVVEYAAAIYADQFAKECDSRSEKVVVAKAEIKAIEEEIASLIEISYQTTSPLVREQYERRIEKRSLQIKQHQAFIDEKIIDYTPAFRTSAMKVLTMLKNPYIAWDSYKGETQRKLFPFFFEENLEYVRNDGYRTPKYSVGIRVLEGNSDPKNGIVDTYGNSLNSFIEFVNKWYPILLDIEKRFPTPDKIK